MGSARPAVSRPGWGREAPGGSGLSWREAPVTPEGGDPRGYYLAHITLAKSLHGWLAINDCHFATAS